VNVGAAALVAVMNTKAAKATPSATQARDLLTASEIPPAADSETRVFLDPDDSLTAEAAPSLRSRRRRRSHETRAV
jgi:hypothetical protein